MQAIKLRDANNVRWFPSNRYVLILSGGSAMFRDKLLVRKGDVVAFYLIGSPYFS